MHSFLLIPLACCNAYIICVGVTSQMVKWVTDVSRTIISPDRRFPDVSRTFPGRLRALTRRLFPVQDVFQTICINNFEYGTLDCSCSKINDELSYAPCTYDYMLLIYGHPM